MDNLRRLGNQMSIVIPPDEQGFIGRECPIKACEGYFKIENGTGLKGDGLPCHCPYCGYIADQGHFTTKEQAKYARSIAARRFVDASTKDLKALEFNYKRKGAFGIGFSMKVKAGPPTPIHYYREQNLETEVTCKNCTLRYAVYGVFGYCPDCGQHNSLQILEKNLELVGKMLDLAIDAGAELHRRLVENALEDCVSAFDGFGREISRINSQKATKPEQALNVSFQNLTGTKETLCRLFGIDISESLTPQEWISLTRGFQKRHLISHKMAVVDKDYIRRAGDTRATVGRKISIEVVEVGQLMKLIGKLARYLFDTLHKA